ncbi:fluoride efflux transporter CrcB [Salinactinospora qingdaonensis]|uniref:Fluoride-specific ion channel FluC n=1 Tax=Salinactinospora qingdaonensis TaxID=702744 RepID=A0ABP7F4G5_9ACTN
MTPLLVALGAAVGAPLRYLIDRFVQTRHESGFPWGTCVVNVIGSFGLGLLLAAPLPHQVGALLGTGTLGALTTYSTFGYQTVQLARDGERTLALLNAVVSLAAGLGTAYCGAAVGGAL